MLMCGTAFNTAAADDIAHDPSRDVQAEGVGNPFNYGERNTPADASTEEIRAINHKMSVQEVKYALYKEIDELQERNRFLEKIKAKADIFQKYLKAKGQEQDFTHWEKSQKTKSSKNHR